VTAYVYSVGECNSAGPTTIVGFAVPRPNMLLVCDADSREGSVTSIVAGGTDMGAAVISQANGTRTARFYALYNPPQGSINIVPTFSGASYWIVRARLFDLVDPTTHYYGAAGNTGSSTNPNVNLTSANGDLAIDTECDAATGATGTPGAGQTRDGTDTNFGANGFQTNASHKPGSPSAVLQWTLSGGVAWAIVGMTIQSAPAAPAPPATAASQIRGSPETGKHDIGDRLQGWESVDNEGELVFEDNFRNDITGWYASAGGTGTAPSKVTTAGLVLIPPNAVKLAVSNAAGQRSRLIRRVYLALGQIFGLEAWFRVTDTPSDTQMTFDYTLPDGSAGYIMGIGYSKGSGVQFWNGSYWQNILTSLTFPASGSDYWLGLKVVGDWISGDYMRVWVGEQKISMIAPTIYAMGTAGLALPGVAQIIIGTTETAGASTESEVGFVLLTRNEPKEAT